MPLLIRVWGQEALLLLVGWTVIGATILKGYQAIWQYGTTFKTCIASDPATPFL